MSEGEIIIADKFHNLINLMRSKGVYELDRWEELVTAGLVLRSAKEWSQFMLGDLAGQVETNYGERSLPKFAEEIGVEPKTLYEYRRIAGKYKKSERIERLSFRHHQIAAGSDDPQEWLVKADDNSWSTRQLYHQIKTKQAEEVEEHEHDWEKEVYRRCLVCNKKEKQPYE